MMTVLNLNGLSNEAIAKEVASYEKTGRLSATHLIGIGAELPTTIFGSNLHNRVATRFGGSIERLLREFVPVRGVAAGGAPSSAGAKWAPAAIVKKSAADRLTDALKSIESLKLEVIAEAKAKYATIMVGARATMAIVGMDSVKISDEAFEAALVKESVADDAGALKVLAAMLKK